MRTVCPSCQSAYDVPEAVLASRRTLRCARCATDFTALADGPEAVAVPALPRAAADLPPPGPKPFQQAVSEPAGRWPGDSVYLATPPASSRTLAQMPPAIMVGWAASVIVLVTMGWAFIAWRAPIMQAWPPSARLYALLRLA